MRYTSISLFVLVCGLLAACSVAWGAVPLTVVNAGFEDWQLDEDAYDWVRDGQGWGWSVSDGIGIWNPTTQFPATPNGAPEGNMIGFVSTPEAPDAPAVGGFAQILAGTTSTLQPDAEYTLTVEVGNTDWYAGFPGYRVELAAGGVQGPAAGGYPGEVTGGTTLVADNNLTPPAEDTFVTVSLSYTAGPIGDALLGQPLQIRLFHLDGALDNEVEFDNVRLDAIYAHPIADPDGPYDVMLDGSLTLDGSGSIPSDGSTISYDWDLNNDLVFGDVTGVSPSALSHDDLTTTYGMAAGENTVGLRVTDALPAAGTATSSTIVSLAGARGGGKIIGIMDSM